MVERYNDGQIRIYQGDCMDLLRAAPDKKYSLALVDPPYGIERFKKGGSLINRHGSHTGKWNNNVPDSEYFNELFRVAKNHIVWGGNYFQLPISGSWIFWDKVKNSGSHANFADGELAWTSTGTVTKKARIPYDGFVGADTERIHPTQKPVKLYRWILQNYAKPGQTILDTHLGSGSIALACADMGFSLDAIELDEEYVGKAIERLKTHKSQLQIF